MAHMSGSDTFALQLERDPLLRATVVAVAVFDRSPSWGMLVERIDRASRLAPNFRSVLAPSPLRLAPPRWVPDPDFDLSWHLTRLRAPDPGGLGEVVEYARHAGMAAFDHNRPLWEFTLLEGLERGRGALVMKVHHSLTDGIGGIQLAAHVVDLERDPPGMANLPSEEAPGRPRSLDRWLDAFTYDTRSVLGHGHALLARLPGTVGRVARDPVAAVGQLAGTASSIARFVRPVLSTLSPVMTERRLLLHFDTLDVPIEGLKAAARGSGGTLNDAFIGGITGGLRRYHERHGSAVDSLRLTMPISVRTEADRPGGNRVTLVRFEVPVGIAEPGPRMRAIDDLTRSLRAERAIPYTDAIASVLNLLPIGFTAGMFKHVDFLASDVPGFDREVFVGGAQLEAFYPFGPTLGAAANLTLMSYRDRCHIGVSTDWGAVPDPDVFMECLHEGFEEVLALAG